MINSLNKVIVLKNIPFSIEDRKVLRELQIKGIQSLKDIKESHISANIQKLIDLAYTLIEGKACYRTFPIIDATDEYVIIQGSENLFRSGNVIRLLQDCDYVTLLVCTIGKRIEEKVEELQSLSISEAFYLDRIGAWMADYMAEYTGKIIENEIIKHGYIPTFRYAPGYGGWKLEAQKEVMRLTEAEKHIGVTITETCIMIPRFSVSAVIGWRRKEQK